MESTKEMPIPFPYWLNRKQYKGKRALFFQLEKLDITDQLLKLFFQIDVKVMEIKSFETSIPDKMEKYQDDHDFAHRE
jgi:hypothetical protein